MVYKNKEWEKNSWMKDYDREELTRRCVDDLEADMELLGITGVEDKLQDNVAVVIESLRNAGI